MKKQIEVLDATPSKRLFLSIIADYDLERSICELVDNGLDAWARMGRKKPIHIAMTLDTEQQSILVEDNAGGLRRDELRYVVAPGQTGNQPADPTIGIFGVGTKRAVVALAQQIKITTRFPREGTHRVEFDDDWLKDDDDWSLPVFAVDEMPAGTTIVDLSKLRSPLSDAAIDRLKQHLSATYAHFLLNNKVLLSVNGESLAPTFFDNWAYPPRYPPQRYTGKVSRDGSEDVAVEVVAGLTMESSPATGEYGVYFYCNDRLVARGLKTIDVGFAKGFAGVAHPKVSLTRVIVSLTGSADAMPWNSSKSEVSPQHPVFRSLQEWLVHVVKDYASLSRIWMGDWPNKVFKYDKGTIRDVKIADFPKARKSFLPPLPKSRPRYAERVAKVNKAIAGKKPWTRGLYEGVIAVELISKNQHLAHRNRLSLIMLDSTLEIAFKEYLVNDSGAQYSDKQLADIFAKRHLVHAEVKRYVTIDNDVWKGVVYYNSLRNKLIHERATADVTDDDISIFRSLVEAILKTLFKLNFKGR